jgi:hypothetical protein
LNADDFRYGGSCCCHCHDWVCETFCIRSSYIPTIIFRLFSILLRYRYSNDNDDVWKVNCSSSYNLITNIL